MTNTLTAEQIAPAIEALETLVATSGHPYKDGLAAVIKSALASLPSPPVSVEAWTDEQISKLGPWQRIMDKGGLDWCRDYSKEGDGHDMAAINKNSLFRLVGLIDALMALLTNEPVGVTDASNLWKVGDEALLDIGHSNYEKRVMMITEGYSGMLPCSIIGNDEGWCKVRFSDESVCTVRPSRLSAAIGEPAGRAALEGET